MGVTDVMLGKVRSVSSVPNGQADTAVGPAFCNPCVTRSRVGTHLSGA
jgi:hypothetical protein